MNLRVEGRWVYIPQNGLHPGLSMLIARLVRLLRLVSR